jgi:hypothetical protein
MWPAAAAQVAPGGALLARSCSREAAPRLSQRSLGPSSRHYVRSPRGWSMLRWAEARFLRLLRPGLSPLARGSRLGTSGSPLASPANSEPFLNQEGSWCFAALVQAALAPRLSLYEFSSMTLSSSGRGRRREGRDTRDPHRVVTSRRGCGFSAGCRLRAGRRL